MTIVMIARENEDPERRSPYEDRQTHRIRGKMVMLKWKQGMELCYRKPMSILGYQKLEEEGNDHHQEASEEPCLWS